VRLLKGKKLANRTCYVDHKGAVIIRPGEPNTINEYLSLDVYGDRKDQAFSLVFDKDEALALAGEIIKAYRENAELHDWDILPPGAE
jgi:hypothetical protein